MFRFLVDKEERYATVTQTFIRLPVPQDVYQMSFSTSSVPWCSTDHVASVTSLAYKSCGIVIMSFAYKTDGTTHSNVKMLRVIAGPRLLRPIQTNPSKAVPLRMTHFRPAIKPSLQQESWITGFNHKPNVHNDNHSSMTIHLANHAAG